jgi:2Fe-2S ferredoxin
MKVKFVPGNVEVEIKSGQTVMDAAQKNGVVIRSTCNGMPSCAECRVRVVEGDWNCNPPSRKELSLIGSGYYIDQRRLSCQLLCFGDVTVDTTEQIEKASEGPVTKKFLTKVHKSSPQESHSLGGVLIEQDEQLLKELKSDVSSQVGAETSASLNMSEARSGGRHDSGQRREASNRNQPRSGGGSSNQGNNGSGGRSEGNRSEGSRRRRRRR